MTNITLEDFDNYLDSGVPLRQAKRLLDILFQYIDEVEGGIDDWYELIPDSEVWGKDKYKRNHLNQINTWLRQLGYQVNLPTLTSDDGDCTWGVCKGGEVVCELCWSSLTKRFFMEGSPEPSTDAELTTMCDTKTPECLTWI